jgi:hypothetical protein
MALTHIGIQRADTPWRALHVPLVSLAAFLALVAASNLAAHLTGVRFTTCPFKLITGLPCATCGVTRMVFAVTTGHFAEAWRLNPLLASAAPVGVLWLAIRATGRRIAIGLSRPARYLAWGVLAVAVAANWAYLIAVGR